MSKFLILKGVGCPVFLDSYILTWNFFKKMGQPYDENADFIDFKGKINVFKKWLNTEVKKCLIQRKN